MMRGRAKDARLSCGEIDSQTSLSGILSDSDATDAGNTQRIEVH